MKFLCITIPHNNYTRTFQYFIADKNLVILKYNEEKGSNYNYYYFELIEINDEQIYSALLTQENLYISTYYEKEKKLILIKSPFLKQ